MDDLLGVSEEVGEDESLAPSGSETDEHVRKFVEDAHAAEKSSRLAREAFWNEGYRLLTNEHDFTGKAAWQAQVIVSKVPNALNAALAILKAGLTQTREFFDLETSEDELERKLLPFEKDLLQAELLDRDVDGYDFLDRWLLGLKQALATAPLVMKIRPVETMKQYRVLEIDELEEPDDPTQALAFQKALAEGLTGVEIYQALGIDVPVTVSIAERECVEIRKELVSPFDYFGDNTQRHLYEIQKIRGDAHELDEMTSEAGYDEDAIEKVREKLTESIDQEAQQEGERTNEPRQSVQARLTWEGVEFWGSIPDQDGKMKWPHHVATVIEGVLVRLEPRPIFPGPFVAAVVEPIPGSQYGRGFVENVAGLARAIIELANAVLDGVAYEVLKAFEIDVGLAAKPEEFKNGIRPGATYSRSDETQGQNRGRLIQPVEVGNISAGAQSALTYLDRSFQEGTQITELVQGLSPARGFPTAREITARQSNSNVAFRSVGQWMEKTSLEPTVQRIYDVMMEFKVFGPGGQEWCEEVLGKERATQFRTLMIAKVQRDGGATPLCRRVRVLAISQMLARAQELEKLTALLGLIKGFPAIVHRLQMGKMTEKIMTMIGFGAEDLLRDKAALDMVQALEDRILANMAEQVGQQPNSHDGPGAMARRNAAPAGTATG